MEPKLQIQEKKYIIIKALCNHLRQNGQRLREI